jgi:hypothetical protein
MANKNLNERFETEWTGLEKTGFRFVFLFFLLQVIPLDWNYYALLFSIHWSRFNVYDLLVTTRYHPFWGLPGFYSWLVVLAVALSGAAIWTRYDKGKTTEYRNLYYWLRVVLRYRLAIGVIGYGLIKLYPLQIPYPSLSNLHTDYGQFLPWKIYYNTIGIVPWYESFLGGVEIVAGVLLFFRRTVTFGAGILVGFLGNVLAANLAYDLGEQVYISLLFLIAAFLLSYDVPRLNSLLLQQRFTRAERFDPVFTPVVRKARTVLRSLFVVFVFLFGIAAYGNFSKDPYLIPKTSGLADSYGFYDVREFRSNNRLIPYSLTDSSRWQNVVFEKWATLSVGSARHVQVDHSKAAGFHADDIDRTYEETGSGQRVYYAYTADSINHTLLLRNKNPYYKDDSLLLHYSRPDTSTILLSGIDRKGDSLSLVLNKGVKKYLFYVGRRQPVKL